MDKHSLVSELKRISGELGRKPERDEFLSLAGITRHQVRLHFGGWIQLVHAAGMGDAAKESAKKEKKPSPFTADLKSVLLNHKSRDVKIQYGGKKMIVIGDSHFPFANVNALSMVYAIIEIEKPDIVVQIGDLYDMYSAAKFPRSHNVYTPQQEYEIGRLMAEDMWKKIREICPKAELFQILGNHDIRPIKRVMEEAPEIEHFLQDSFKKCFQFEGVNFHEDFREPLVLESIALIHGYLSGLGKHRDKLRRSVICGHSHLGGVSYANYGDETLFEGNAGFIGDERSKVMGYMPTRVTGWTLGLFEVDALGPRFIHF